MIINPRLSSIFFITGESEISQLVMTPLFASQSLLKEWRRPPTGGLREACHWSLGEGFPRLLVIQPTRKEGRFAGLHCYGTLSTQDSASTKHLFFLDVGRMPVASRESIQFHGKLL